MIFSKALQFQFNSSKGQRVTQRVKKLSKHLLTNQTMYEEQKDPILPAPELVPIPVFLKESSKS